MWIIKSRRLNGLILPLCQSNLFYLICACLPRLSLCHSPAEATAPFTTTVHVATRPTPQSLLLLVVVAVVMRADGLPSVHLLSPDLISFPTVWFIQISMELLYFRPCHYSVPQLSSLPSQIS